MIVRPHICLRCQIRLAKGISSRSQVVFQSTAAKLQVASDPATKEYTAEEGEIEPSQVRDSFAHQSKLPRRSVLSQYPLGKLYGHSGQKKRENRERLGIDALGEPTNVIVLRDTKLSTYTSKEYIDGEEPESIDILAALDNERGLVGQKEVEENINQFRPEDGKQPRNWDDFNKIVQELQKGFTVSQLARYIQSFEVENKGKSPSKANAGFLIPRISPWMPETSRSIERLDDDSVRGYSAASYTSKQRLVLRLIRECWKLELPELEEGIGEVELELKPRDYDLLLKGQRSVLGSIAAVHIDGENERIDGFRSRHTIRITTTRPKSELIVHEIEQALKNVQQRTISLLDLKPPSIPRAYTPKFYKWTDVHFDEETIQALGNITKTDIQVLPKRKLHIRSVDPHPKSTTSRRIDVATRLLLTSGNFSNRVTDWLGCKETPTALNGTFVDYTSIDGLGWRDRLRHWTRWTAPTARNNPNQDEVDETDKGESQLEAIKGDHSKVVPREQQVIETKPDEPQTKTKGYVSWARKYHVESSALLGSVLHSHPETPEPPQIEYATTPTSKVQRAFSTAVPNLSKLLGSTSTRLRRDNPRESLIMRFQPNPFSIYPANASKAVGATALSAFPSIEMRFHMDSETKALDLKDIRAIISLENSDLMLPDSAVDIRFQQRIVSRLRVLHYNYPAGIAEFLKNSVLDVAKGKVETPPKITIPLPSHLCQDPGFELLGKKVDDIQMQNVEYLFTGLEIRKTMVLEFESWRMLYTSIEAGRAGGRRGELRLRPIREKRFGKIDTEEDFVNAAHRIAECLGTGKSETPPRKYLDTLVKTPVFKNITGKKLKKRKFFANQVDITDHRHWKEKTYTFGDEDEFVGDDDEFV